MSLCVIFSVRTVAVLVIVMLQNFVYSAVVGM